MLLTWGGWAWLAVALWLFRLGVMRWQARVVILSWLVVPFVRAASSNNPWLHFSSHSDFPISTLLDW